MLSSDVVSRILNETANFIILSPSCKVPCCAETVPKTKISVIPRSSYKQKQLLQTKKKQITQGCSSLTSHPVVLPTTIGSSPTWRDSAFPGRQAEGRQKKVHMNFFPLCSTEHNFILLQFSVHYTKEQKWQQSPSLCSQQNRRISDSFPKLEQVRIKGLFLPREGLCTCIPASTSEELC